MPPAQQQQKDEAQAQAQANHEGAQAPSPSAPGTDAHADGQDAQLAAMTNELRETEALIAAHERKLELLGRIRRELLTGKPAGALAALPHEFWGHRGGSTGLGSPRPQLSDYIVPRSRTAVASLTALALSNIRCRTKGSWSGRTPAATVPILAACTSEGNVHFVEADTGDSLGTYSGGGGGAVTAAHIWQPTGARGKILLMTGHADGTVRSVSLTMWRDGAVVAGEPPAVRSGDDNGDSEAAVEFDANGEPIPSPGDTAPAGPQSQSPSGYAVAAATGEGQGENGGREGEDEGGAHRAIHALAVHVQRRRRLVLAGDAGGAIHAFHANGSLAETIATGSSAPVTALTVVGRGRLAFTAGKDVRFLSLSTMKTLDYACRGSLASVVSLAMDAVSTDVLYAGTKAGEVIVFSTGSGGGKRSSRSAGCRPLRKLAPLAPLLGAAAGTEASETAGVQSLGALRGYVLVTTGGDLTIRNLTDSYVPVHHAPMHLAVGSKSTVASAGAASAAGLRPVVAVTGNTGRGNRGVATYVALATLGAGGNGNISVYQSLLPYSKPGRNAGGGIGSFDIGNVRMYVLGAVAIGVFGWQWLKRSRRDNFARNTLNNPEFMKGFRDFQQERGGGRGFGGANAGRGADVGGVGARAGAGNRMSSDDSFASGGVGGMPAEPPGGDAGDY